MQYSVRWSSWEMRTGVMDSIGDFGLVSLGCHAVTV